MSEGEAQGLIRQVGSGGRATCLPSLYNAFSFRQTKQRFLLRYRQDNYKKKNQHVHFK